MTVFRPGLCTVTFRQLSPEDIVALSAECGIVGIEWAGDVHVPAGQIDVARHVRSLTEEAGLSVVSYGSYIAPPSDDERAFATVLETAQALGAPNIRIWPGTRESGLGDLLLRRAASGRPGNPAYGQDGRRRLRYPLPRISSRFPDR